MRGTGVAKAECGWNSWVGENHEVSVLRGQLLPTKSGNAMHKKSSTYLIFILSICWLPLGCGDYGQSDSGAMGYTYNGGSTGGSTGGSDGGYYMIPEEPDPDEPENTGDKYDAPFTNPYVMTESNPLSSFAADVDTASYDIFRRDILKGVLPIAAGVRLEEYVNFFPYDYEAPGNEAEHPFSLYLDASPNPYTDGTTLFRVGIKGKMAPPEKAGMSANLVFLIDVSGSMSSAAKLPLVKTVLNETLEILKPSDTVAIVTYASGTKVRLESTPVSEKATIKKAINSLQAGGSTNGAGGIQLAYEQAQKAFVEGGINHVILCTDGDFNVGVSGTAALVDLIKEKRKTGITFTVLGFGWGNLNDAMMEATSNAGNGVYGVISDEDQAITYVNKRLLSNIYFIAKDVKIQVEFNPNQVLAYRLLGYENRALTKEEFLDHKTDAGEIGSEHTVTALYELVMTGGEIPSPEGAPSIDDGEPYDGKLSFTEDLLCTVRIRYKEVDAVEADPSFELTQHYAGSELPDTFGEAANDLRWAASIAAFAEILSGSPFGAKSNLALIEAVIQETAGDDPDRSEFVGLMNSARQKLEAKP
jgi:Ca-activated chloride channel family protein